ncbi:MAG: hypothetical protein LBL75_00180 [Rickettsiales bacterium]|jgi:hypothetical protein|nr:hypothetical protein [Rickettsiales bacterium]
MSNPAWNNTYKFTCDNPCDKCAGRVSTEKCTFSIQAVPNNNNSAIYVDDRILDFPECVKSGNNDLTKNILMTTALDLADACEYNTSKTNIQKKRILAEYGMLK